MPPHQHELDLTPEPEIHPLYPSPDAIVGLLDGSSPLTLEQRRTLVAHSLAKAVLFADITLLTFLLRNTLTRSLIDLEVQDEDGLGLVSQSIMGFGEECDRDVEREESARLLISEGADILSGDSAGWTPLHFAALHAPPTLIAHLLKHGASPLAKSLKGLTPLDVINAYEELPNRSHVALLLEEAMREAGWYGSERERRRQRKKIRRDAREQKVRRRRQEWNQIGSTLDLPPDWWGEDYDDHHSVNSDDNMSDSEDSDDSDDEDPLPYTPPHTYDSMLVFSLPDLPQLLDSLIINMQPVLRPMSRRASPANGLYYLARFACVWCDPTWLEELVVCAVDKIEETVHARPEDLSHLSFWLFNTTLLIHLLRCDNQLNETLEEMELFGLMEELLNAIFVFVIRVIEKKIDPLIDPALLDHSPLVSEFESIQFESEWSFLRSFTTPKKKPAPISPPSKTPASPTPSPSIPQAFTPNSINHLLGGSPRPSSTGGGGFSSLLFRSTPSRSPNPFQPQEPPATPAPTNPNSPSPTSITTILTAIHTLLSLYGINPVLIIQANSQVLYWTACEMFNRLISRKTYLCRSRAMQIGMNVGIVEEWVTRVGLPKAVTNHFACVRQLLSWLQCLSSINDFAALVDTLQTMKSINPLQMRRAVKDYRYEVNEGRMTDECSQYLAQMQKDWERQRIKLGVELARKERRRERDEDMPSSSSDEAVNSDATSWSSSNSREKDEAQRLMDNLFDRDHPKSDWAIPKPPEPLGELMNSRYMLPLILPSDPRLLSAGAGIESLHPPGIFTAGMDSASLMPSTPGPKGKASSASLAMMRNDSSHSRSSSRASQTSHGSVASMMSLSRGPMRWREQGRRVREVEVDLLELVGGVTHTVWGTFGVRFLNTDMTVESAGWNVADEAQDVADIHLDTDGEDNNHDDETEVTPSAKRVIEVPEGETGPGSDAHSVSSSRSTRSHLTPNLPRPTADKRRSMRLARRSSGGDTIMAPYDHFLGASFEDTPINERPMGGLA